VTPAEALESIRRAGISGAFVVSGHARQRMRERGAGLRDVRNAMATATQCRAQETGRWRTDGGVDDDGDELSIVVVFDGGTIVVTLY